MVERTGWLLDLYEDPLGGLVLWLLDDDGARRRLRQRFPVTFYATGRAERLVALNAWLAADGMGLRQDRALPAVKAAAAAATRPAAARPAALPPETSPPATLPPVTPSLAPAAPIRTALVERMDVFAGRSLPALAVEVQRPSDLPGLFRAASRAFPELEFADADLAITLRYAAACGVSLLGRCRVRLDEADFVQSIEPLDSPWDLDPLDPPLRVLRLAPECDPAHAEPRRLRVTPPGQPERWLALHPARPLLVNLRALLVEHDPDLLLTAWGDTWLLPRLLALSEEAGLPLPLNRDPLATITRREERWYFSYGQLVYRGEQVHLLGRWHVDCKNAMLWSDYELEGVLEMARVTGLPLQTAARVSPGTGISSIQMLTALRRGILVPWQKQQAEFLKPAAGLYAADQGGLVFQPIMGVHRNVAAIDFISMFPSIMVYFNLSPETIGAARPQAVRVPGLDLWVDHSQEGLVPCSLRPLLQKRVALKLRQPALARHDPRRQRDKCRASALKWLLVTCFGYLGYKNARFGRIEAHQAVTAYAREALLRAKEAAEAAGLELIHAYVDGLWLKRPDESAPTGLPELLAEIERQTGLPIACDGVYRWVVFLASRVNPNRPVANRYFGVFENGEIKVRGIAARRKDSPPWIVQGQMALIELLAGAPQPEQAVLAARQALGRLLAELRAGRVPLEQLLVSQRISRDLEDYRSPPPAARAALQLRAAGKLVKPGQRVRFLYTLGEPGVHAWDLPGAFDARSLDIPRYRELLLRAAAEVFEPFMQNPEGLSLLDF